MQYEQTVRGRRVRPWAAAARTLTSLRACVAMYVASTAYTFFAPAC